MISKTESTFTFIFITSAGWRITLIGLDRLIFSYFHLGVVFAFKRDHIEVVFI